MNHNCKNNLNKITDLMKETYGDYFGVKLRHQNKPFAAKHV